MKQTSLAIALALTGALTACGPLGVAPGGPSPAASKKPKADDGAKDPTPVVTTAATPDAAGILGKMKEPVGLVRQSAFVASLHDALPVSLASGGLGVLNAATSLVSNNGGGLVANNGGGVISDHGGAYRATLAFGLLQEPVSVLGDILRIRKDVVMHQQPETASGGKLSLYDPRTFDPKPGADNAGALIDRFQYELGNIQALEDGTFSGDFEMTILSSKRIAFVDRLVVRQTSKPEANDHGFENVRFDYFVGFDVKLPDGTVDRAEMQLVSTGADLVRDQDENGKDVPGTETPGRMTIGGGNGHGTYGGEVRFPAGGAIDVAFTHTRAGGAKTTGTMALRPDGSATNEATSEGGDLALKVDRAVDGRLTFEVRDLAGGKAVVLPNVVSEAGGIGTFDFGTAEKPRARLF